MRAGALSSKNDLLIVTESHDRNDCQASGQRANNEYTLLATTKAYFTFIVLLAILCTVQIGWNMYLTKELASVRQDVMFLKQELVSQKKPAFPDDAFEDNGSRNEMMQFMDPSTEQSQSEQNFPAGLVATDVNSHKQKPTVVHALAKRSAEVPVAKSGRKGRRKGKKPKREGKKKKECGRLRRTIRNAVMPVPAAIAIHIQANEDITNYLSPTDGETLVAWTIPPAPRFQTDELLTRGYIRVPKDGFYFVYSQVVFQTNSIQHMVAEMGVKTFGAEIFSKCLFSRPNNATPNSYVTCTSNGVVKLSRGQGISVKVRPPGITILMRSQSTYFGAFYLGK